MAVRIAINGFGRIGRLTMRAAFEADRKDLEVVAINDLGPVEANTYLLKYDSVHGPFPGKVRASGNSGMVVGNRLVKVLSERDPAKLPWGDVGVDVVLECTGRFTKKEQAVKHIEAGAKRVLISAPATNVDLTVVYGVNHDKLNKKHTVVSNASCTTNCLAPVASVLHKVIGIERGYMTTIHAYTGDQRLVDTMHSDMRRSRAAAVSMIPTSTGAARAVALVLPALKGKLDGTAIRVPTANVSMIDFTFTSKRKTTPQEINNAMVKASKGMMEGILAVTDEQLVSIDFNHNPASAIFDLTQTQVIEERFCRVLAWYDNEWGFSNRMCDTALRMGKMK
ncbi:MAG: type I glyceraldehyde-3-phosphate dehydrogenase [Alphaproteobacteria bacterium]|nr:type I glyceraldehyde-3-phosphate dehydrogenase [Alphaproteobacteria bacterium]